MNNKHILFIVLLIVLIVALTVALGITTMVSTVYASTRGVLTNEDDALRAYRLSHPAVYANSPYWSREFVLEYDRLHWSLTDAGYWQADDFHGVYYNVTNGIRHTAEQPKRFDHTLWLLGNSAVFDPFVPDTYTSASQIQRLMPHGWRVVNLGVDGMNATYFKVWLSTQDVRPGDSVVLVDGAMDTDGRTYTFSYHAKIGKLQAYVKSHGATFHHFMQPIIDSRFDMTFQQMADGAVLLRVPPALFVDWDHTNEVGGSIVVRAIADAIAPTF